MNLRIVSNIISLLTGFIAAVFGLCTFVSYLAGDAASVQRGLLHACIITAAFSLITWYLTRGPMNLKKRDSLGIVGFGWLMIALFGTLPYLLTGVISSPFSAYFESMSGLTTTGSTVLSNLEEVPRGVMFWRCISQWIGGMGILVLAIAILPFVGSGGAQLFKSEAPGLDVKRITPRIASTARVLWGLYLGLTVVSFLVLWALGMNLFDAVCHAFTVSATGGFSTRSSSIAAFDSPAIEAAIIVFILFSAVNFTLHWQFRREKFRVYWRDPECRFMGLVFLVFTFLLLLELHFFCDYGWVQGLRSSLFTVATLLTTTGFGTDDFTLWSPAAQLLVFLLFIPGACSGSTSGGIKLVRILIAFKTIAREIKKLQYPTLVARVKVGKQKVEENALLSVAALFMLYLIIFAVSIPVMGFFCPDGVSVVTSVASALGNIGPGLGPIGPAGSFAVISDPGLVYLSFLMLLGRLEYFCLLVLFTASFWKK